MKTYGPRYHVKTRRHREGRTDYRRRLGLLRSKKIRLVIRRSLKQIRIQFILLTIQSNELKKNHNWKYPVGSIPAAYLTGLIAGKKAQEAGIDTCILDIGRQRSTKGSNLYAAMKGVIDTGITCPHNEDMIPANERLMGQHIKAEMATNIEKLKNQIIGGA